jgi:hypothetical protein
LDTFGPSANTSAIIAPHKIIERIFIEAPFKKSISYRFAKILKIKMSRAKSAQTTYKPVPAINEM